MSQKEIDRLKSRVSAIVALSEKEERDLTPAESDECDALLSEAAELYAAEQKRQRFHAKASERFSDPNAWPEDSPVRAMLEKNRTGAHWRVDGNGRQYAVLSKGQKATDVFSPKAADEMSHFILAKVFGASHATPGHIKATMTTSNNADGGFLVPDTLSGQVIDLARSKSVLARAGVQTILMPSGSMTIPALEQDISVATKAQGQAFQQSAMKFGARTLNAHTAGCYVRMSRELFEDAAEIVAQQLTAFMAAEMARQIDEWGLNGSGSQQPLGLLPRTEMTGAGQLQSTGSIGAIDWLDVSAAATEVRNSNHEPVACVLNTEIYDDLLTIESGDAVNSARNWLGRPETLAGVEFLPTSHCPEAKLVIGDFSKYALGVRVGTRVEASAEADTAFINHEVLIKVFSRIDFVPLDISAMYALTGITS